MKKLICFMLFVMLLLGTVPFSATATSEEVLTVIAFGDSITAADKWQKYVEKAYGIDIINAGVGGDSTHTAKTRFKKDVLDKNPDIVFISLGTNDSAIDMAKYTPLEDYKANMGYFIDECKKIGARVIVNIPTPVVDSIYLTRHEEAPFEPYGGPNGLMSIYAEAAREIASEKNVISVDLNAVFLATDDYTVYFPDGVHPSDTGYRMYGEAVIEAYKLLTLGDATCDGMVDQYDYILIKRAHFKTVTLDENQLFRADINLDGEVDQYDYLLSKRHHFGTYTVLGR